MGYDTKFLGKVKIEPEMKPAHIFYINLFGDTRRMKRDATKAQKLPDPHRVAVELPVGIEGGYFVGGGGDCGQVRDVSVLDYNHPPKGQPGLWCKWEITQDGKFLQWSGMEKFYDYVEWMKYLIEHFLAPWGYVLNGEIFWQGEEIGDVGNIIVRDSKVTTERSAISDRIDGDDVRTETGFQTFLTDAMTWLQTAWEERGGDEIGEMEGRALQEALVAFFGDKRHE